MNRPFIAIVATILSSPAIAAGPCDQYAYYVDTLAGRKIYYTPTYQHCMTAQWAARIGKAAGLKGPNDPEVAAKRDAEQQKRDEEHTRYEEMMAKARAINDQYNQSRLNGFIGKLLNSQKEQERNDKVETLAEEYGYNWNRSDSKFTKKTPQQISQAQTRARELEFMVKVKDLNAQYQPTNDQAIDEARLQERNDRVLALAREYGYTWDSATGQFLNEQSQIIQK
jgi:hypothetical protein